LPIQIRPSYVAHSAEKIASVVNNEEDHRWIGSVTKRSPEPS